LLVVDDPLVSATLDQILQNDDHFSLTGIIGLAKLADADLDPQQYNAILIDLGWNSAYARSILTSIPILAGILVLFPEGISPNDPLLSPYNGVIPRSSSPEIIRAALAAVAAGLTVREKPSTGSLYPTDESPLLTSPVDPLTPRENQVLACLLEGLPNKMIAQRLGISEHTAKFHVTSILSKLGAQSRTEAVIRATRLGLIRL